MSQTVRISEELFEKVVTIKDKNQSFKDALDQLFDMDQSDEIMTKMEIEQLVRRITQEEIEELRRR